MKILLATDGTSASDAAVDTLLHLPLPRVAEIIVLTVVPDARGWDVLPELPAETLCLTPDGCEAGGVNWEPAELTFAEDLLRDAARRLSGKAGFVRTVLRVGKPADEILHVADTMEVDLIVMGNKERTGIDRWVLGSVSEKVLQQARCPVLVAKSREGGQPCKE